MKELNELVQSLRPVKTNFEMIRIGGANDGGYLVPNDLKGITACFSPGVDVTATFEKDLLKRGIGSHLADASVSGAPDGFKPLSFTKKFLGAINDGDYMTLEHWVIRNTKFDRDLILQMDIEGAEYETILAMPSNLLYQFRIIVMEIHHAHSWFGQISWSVVSTFFRKLLKDYHVVHLHPNNNCPFVSVDDFMVPDTFEITLLRKDRSPATGFADQFPHPFDAPNVLDKPDRPLPEEWYK